MILIEDQPWFVGKDIATALGYKDTSDAIKRHVDDDDKLTRCFTDSGQNRNMLIVNESGMYSLILSSKLPNAKKFKRWVTSDILPSIRKHGVYATDELIANPDLAIAALTALKEEREKSKVLEAQLDYSKEWYSIKRVASINNVPWKRFDWRKLKNESNAVGIPPKKIFDANYGEVNTYHMKVWEEAYPEYEL